MMGRTLMAVHVWGQQLQGGLQAPVAGSAGQPSVGTPSVLLTQGSNRLPRIGRLSHSFHFPGRLAHVGDG